MNNLLATFFEQYGLILILLLAFALMMAYYFLKNRKFQQTENDFQNSLKVGDKVKTYSGFYGTVVKITNTTDGKVISLKLGENAVIDVDIRALMGLDLKEELKEVPAENVEEKAEEPKEEVKEEEEKPVEEAKELEEKPEKKPRAKKAENAEKKPAKPKAKK